MSKELWPVWIKSSTASYFKNRFDPSVCFILESEDIPDPPNDLPRIELRIDGPDIKEYDTTNNILYIYINVLIITKKNQNDLYYHERLLGKAVDAMARAITIQEQGGDYFGCMLATDDIQVTNYGEIDKAPELIQSTVERSYKITL